MGGAPRGGEAVRFAEAAAKAAAGKDYDGRALEALVPLREPLTQGFDIGGYYA